MEERHDDGPDIIFEDDLMQHGFLAFPRVVWVAKNLSMGAKCTYGMLLHYAWHDSACFPGQERLAEDMNTTSRSVRSYIKELVDAGLIRVKQRGLGRTNLYTLCKLGADQNRKPTSATDRKPASTQDRKPASYYLETDYIEADYIEPDQGGADAQPHAFFLEPAWLGGWVAEFVRRIGWKKPLAGTLRKLADTAKPFLKDLDHAQRVGALDYLFSNDYLRSVSGGIYTAVKADLELWVAKGMPSSKNGSARGGGKKLTGSAAHRMDWDMSLPEQRAMLEEETRGANVCPDCGITQGRHIAWCAVKPEGAEIVPDPFADPTDTGDPLYQPLRRS